MRSPRSFARSCFIYLYSLNTSDGERRQGRWITGLASDGFAKNEISMENRNCLDESNRLNQGRPSGHPRSLKGGFKYEVQHGLTRRETPRGVS